MLAAPSRCAGDGGSTSTGAALPAEEDEGGRPPGPSSQNHSGLLLQPESFTGTCVPELSNGQFQGPQANSWSAIINTLNLLLLLFVVIGCSYIGL